MQSHDAPVRTEPKQPISSPFDEKVKDLKNEAELAILSKDYTEEYTLDAFKKNIYSYQLKFAVIKKECLAHLIGHAQHERLFSQLESTHQSLDVIKDFTSIDDCFKRKNGQFVSEHFQHVDRILASEAYNDVINTVSVSNSQLLMRLYPKENMDRISHKAFIKNHEDIIRKSLDGFTKWMKEFDKSLQPRRNEIVAQLKKAESSPPTSPSTPDSLDISVNSNEPEHSVSTSVSNSPRSRSESELDTSPHQSPVAAVETKAADNKPRLLSDISDDEKLAANPQPLVFKSPVLSTVIASQIETTSGDRLAQAMQSRGITTPPTKESSALSSLHLSKPAQQIIEQDKAALSLQFEKEKQELEKKHAADFAALKDQHAHELHDLAVKSEQQKKAALDELNVHYKHAMDALEQKQKVDLAALKKQDEEEKQRALTQQQSELDSKYTGELKSAHEGHAKVKSKLEAENKELKSNYTELHAHFKTTTSDVKAQRHQIRDLTQVNQALTERTSTFDHLVRENQRLQSQVRALETPNKPSPWKYVLLGIGIGLGIAATATGIGALLGVPLLAGMGVLAAQVLAFGVGGALLAGAAAYLSYKIYKTCCPPFDTDRTLTIDSTLSVTDLPKKQARPQRLLPSQTKTTQLFHGHDDETPIARLFEEPEEEKEKDTSMIQSSAPAATLSSARSTLFAGSAAPSNSERTPSQAVTFQLGSSR